MKKVAAIVGFLLFAIVTVVASNAFYTHHQSSRYADTAVPYIEKLVPEISRWDPAVIKTYMAPGSLERLSDEKIDQIVAYLSRLGELEGYDQPQFDEIYTMEQDGAAEKTILYYTVEARYESGDATFNLHLVDRGESFQVHNFTINSAALGSR